MRKEFTLHFSGLLKKLFWCFIIIAVILIAIIAIFPNNDTVPIFSERSVTFNDDWKLENTGELITLPYIYDSSANEVVTISKILPDVFKQSNPTLSFHSSLQSIKIEVGGNVIYDYCQQPDAYLDVQPPPAWHIVRLSPDMAGKTLRIIYASPYSDFAGVLNNIDIGTKIATVTTFLTSRILSMAVCMIIFAFGLFAITICLFAHNRLADLSRLMYLGIGSVLISMWSACETKAMQVFTENVQLIMFITFLSIMLFPIAFLLFFRESFSGRFRNFYNVMISVFSGYFILNVILQFFNIANFNDFFPLFLVMVGIMLVFVLCSLISAYRKDKTEQTRMPVIAISFLLLFALVDMYRYFFQNLGLTSYSDTSQFVRIGILVMLFTLGYSSIRQVLTYYSESTKAELYKTLSQTDSMSGLKNRAYLSENGEQVFKEMVSQDKPVSIIMADIDNFKSYNDHYGHTAGDEVIRTVAGILLNVAEEFSGTAFRYGGEEFMLVIPSAEKERAIVVAQRIKQLIQEKAIPHAYSDVSQLITVSQGICSAVPTSNDSLEKFIDYSDRAMYQIKNANKNGYAVYQDNAQECSFS